MTYLRALALGILLCISTTGQAAFDYLDDVVQPEPQSRTLSVQPIFAPTRKHIAVFKVIRAEAPPLEEQNTSAVKGLARSIDNYFSYYARDAWDIEVRGYNLYSECTANPPVYCKAEIKEYIATHDMEGFDPNYFHLWGGLSGYCGQAGIHYAWSVRYANSACNNMVSMHELGHNFGWHHAGTLNVVSGKNSEYGDLNAVMGGPHSRTNVGLISNNLFQENMGKTTNIIEDTQQIMMAPLELEAVSLHPGEIQNHIVWTGAVNYYTLSMRKTKGTPYPSTASTYSISIHEVHPDGRTKLIALLHHSDPVYTLPNGVLVEYVSYSRERIQANVFMSPDDPAPEDKVFATGFPTPENAVITPEHTGAWYDPDYNGQGFEFQVRDGRAVVYWYTYSTYGNFRRWYVGTCNIEENCKEGFQLYSTKDGTFGDPLASETFDAGTAQFYFTDDMHGVFNYEMPDFGIGSVRLTAIALNDDNPITGSWYHPDTAGSGFTTQRYGDLLVMYWYTYGPREFIPYNTINAKAIQTQRWYVMTGTETSPGVYAMTIYETSNARWMHPSTTVTETEVGSAIVSLVDGKLLVDYNIMAERVTASGSYELIQLF
jgi:hypothetical protein